MTSPYAILIRDPDADPSNGVCRNCRDYWPERCPWCGFRGPDGWRRERAEGRETERQLELFER